MLGCGVRGRLLRQQGAFLNGFRAQESAWGGRAIAQVNLSRTDAVGSGGLHLRLTAQQSQVGALPARPGKDVAVDLRAGSATRVWHPWSSALNGPTRRFPRVVLMVSGAGNAVSCFIAFGGLGERGGNRHPLL